jgi:hypothetical protein
MTMPSKPQDSEKFSLSAGLMVVAVVYVILFQVWFYTRTLPNNAPLTRAEVWAEIPAHLLSLLDVVDPPPPEPGAVLRPQGFSYLRQRLPNWGVSGLILLAAIGLGLRVLQRCQNTELTVTETICFAISLGISGLALLVLVIGWTIGLIPWLFWTIVSGLAVYGAWDGVRLLSQLVTGWQGITRSLRPWCWLSGIIAAIYFAAYLLGATSPSTDFDYLEYHLQGPKEYWQRGRIHFLEHNVYTSFPFLTEMLLLLGMVLWNDPFNGALTGQVVLMTLGPLTALSVFAATNRLMMNQGNVMAADLSSLNDGSLVKPAVSHFQRSPSPKPNSNQRNGQVFLSSIAAGLILLTTPWIYRVSTVAYTDGGLTAYTAFTLLAALVWYRSILSGVASPFQSLPPGMAFIVGLLAGSAMACKYTGLVLVVIPAGLLMLTPARARWSQTVRYATGCTIAIGPWLLKNLIETGNPVYPLGYRVFGGAFWTSTMNAKWSRAHAPDDYHPLGLVTWMYDIACINDWQSGAIFVFVPIAVLFGRRLPRGTGLIIASFCWIFVVWWATTHRLDRFWVPILAPAAVLAGLGFAASCRSWWRALATASVMAATTYNFAFITSGLSGYSSGLTDLAYARDYSVRITSPEIACLNRAAIVRVNQSVGPTAKVTEMLKVLLVGEAAVFNADFPIDYSTVFDDLRLRTYISAGNPSEMTSLAETTLASAAEIRSRFSDKQIKFILVNWREVLRYRLTYGYDPLATPATFQRLIDLEVLGPPIPWQEIISGTEATSPGSTAAGLFAGLGQRPANGLSTSEKASLAEWGSELLQQSTAGPVFVTSQLFPVKP